MRKLKLFVYSVPISVAGFEAYERRIGVPLPDDFREFCLAYNGGYPSSECNSYPVPSRFTDFWEEYWVLGDAPSVEVQLFYGVPPVEKQYSSEEVGEFLIEKRGVPKGWRAVAGDGCGNHVLLARHRDGWDGLHYWDNDTRETYKIADSCGEFYEGLQNRAARSGR